MSDEQKNAKNCWEYWNCDMAVRQTCPAFTGKAGNKCWMVAGTMRDDGIGICPKTKNKFASCLECPWFQQVNPD
jgi:hypothetical protein